MKGYFKFLLVIAVIFLASCSSSNGDNQTITGDDERLLFTDNLLAVELNGKWGYIDSSGKVEIEFEYDNASAFILGSAIVVKDDQYAMIDTKNRLLTDWYDYLYKDEANGLVWFIEDDKLGLLDEKGKVILPAEYTDFSEYSYGFSLNTRFSGGYAKVSKDGEHGFIDAKGKFIIPMGEAIQLRNFNFGYASFYDPEEGLSGYKDTSNKVVIEAKYDSAGNFNKFSQAIVQIRKEDSSFANDYFVIDHRGNTVIDRADDIRFYGEAYRVRRDDEMFFVDEKGKPFNDNVYSSISNISWWSSYPFFIAGDKVINQFGEVVHEDESKVYDFFVNGLDIVFVEKDGHEFTIIDGRKTITFEADDVYDYTSDFIAIERDGKVGVIDHKDKEIIPFEYYAVVMSDDGFFILVDEDFRIGLADSKGKVIFEPTYDSIELDINPY